MKAIAAVSGNWAIGRGNDLLYHIPEDMKFFHSVTEGRTILIGRKNLESFPGGRPLKNRRTLVLTARQDYEKEGIEVFHSSAELFRTLKDIPADELWLCGGGVVYQAFLPFCSEALITHIDDEMKDAEVFFPDLNREPGWFLTQDGEWHEYNGLRYKFCVWTNRDPLPIPCL